MISRGEARLQGLTHYFTGKPCKYGHVAKRRVDNLTCMQCASARASLWQLRNPERTRSKNAAWYQSNTELAKQRAQKWAAANPARRREIMAQNRVQRRAAAVPLSKADRDWMAFIYETCPSGWEVDHIHPINGENFCGLHVPWNLQHLPSEVNRKKGNRLS